NASLSMRILSAFFAVLFTFINPCMMYKVVTELESCFSRRLPERLRVRIIETVCAYVFNNNLSARIRLAVYITVILFTLVHLMLTCFSLYGTYSCRPALIRPFLFDAVFSFVLLLLFVCFSVIIYWQLTSSDFVEDREDAMKQHLRNVYVGAAFLLSYLVWMIVSIAAYLDTKKLHADFMYWIVEERMSMRSKANVSSDLRQREELRCRGAVLAIVVAVSSLKVAHFGCNWTHSPRTGSSFRNRASYGPRMTFESILTSPLSDPTDPPKARERREPATPPSAAQSRHFLGSIQ
ncbi:hypothetical protein Y032_0368g45, partial [Ancylostoma ceylanicum]